MDCWTEECFLDGFQCEGVCGPGCNILTDAGTPTATTASSSPIMSMLIGITMVAMLLATILRGCLLSHQPSSSMPPSAILSTKCIIVLTVSHTVWVHVVVPYILESKSDGHPLTRNKCVRLMALAESMFPLVPRACAAVLATRNVRLGGTRYRSSYFALECAAIAACDDGRGRCVRWIVGHRDTRDSYKDCLAVFRGLCVGGHLRAAQSLAARSNPSPTTTTATSPVPAPQRRHCGRGSSSSATCDDLSWMRNCGLSWPAGERGEDADDDVRDVHFWSSDQQKEPLLCSVCRAGHLKIARWMVHRFGASEAELGYALGAAAQGGHLDVVKWLFGETHYCPGLSSGDLDVIKWLVGKCPAVTHPETMAKKFLGGKKRAEEKIEGCKWFAFKFPAMEWEECVESCREAKTLRWMLDSGLVTPSKKCLLHAVHTICDVSLVEWLIDSCHVFLTIDDHVFTNKRDSVPVVQLVLQRETQYAAHRNITVPDMLCKALGAHNMAVANWLQERYHNIMGSEKVELSAVAHALDYGYKPLEWLVNRLLPRIPDEGDLMNAVVNCLRKKNFPGALFLLKKFDIPHSEDTNEMWDTVLLYAAEYDFKSISEIYALLMPTQSQAGKSLSVHMLSSKSVKWVVETYHLNAEDIKRKNTIDLLQNLLRKTNCAEWLIQRFDITLPQVLSVLAKAEGYLLPWIISLSTWRMLLRRFPGISAAIRYVPKQNDMTEENDKNTRTRNALLNIVLASPRHISLSIKKLGLAVPEILDYANTTLPRTQRDWLCDETKDWLADQAHTPAPKRPRST
ncbi:hypothetical protein Pelo_6111 [Pelomyxa schiedti]|nr:hypothetical protein Pelo_6111 [Pelomyxa schiedti]